MRPCPLLLLSAISTARKLLVFTFLQRIRICIYCIYISRQRITYLICIYIYAFIELCIYWINIYCINISHWDIISAAQYCILIHLPVNLASTKNMHILRCALVLASFNFDHCDSHVNLTSRNVSASLSMSWFVVTGISQRVLCFFAFLGPPNTSISTRVCLLW